MQKLTMWMVAVLAASVIAGCALSSKAYYLENPTSAKQLEAALGKSHQVVKQEDGSERWIYRIPAGDTKGSYYIIQNDRVIEAGPFF
jgi:hypothetical protein